MKLLRRNYEIKIKILLLLIFFISTIKIKAIPCTDWDITYWATSVIDYHGSNADSTIGNILGPPDGALTDVGTADGATMNNYLVVEFASPFRDGEGSEVTVCLYDLDTFETFWVYIKKQNVPGTRKNTKPIAWQKRA